MEEKPRGGQRGRVQEDEARVELLRLPRLRVDHAHAFGPARLVVTDQAVGDGMGTESQPARGRGGGKGRGVAREVRAIGTAAVAEVPTLAGAAPVVRPRQHGHVAHDQVPAGERRRDALPQVPLEAVHLERRQQVALGELGEAGLLPADADESLDAVVPGREVRVAQRPVDPDAFLEVGFEVEVAPAEAVARPEQRTPADLVAPEPVERLLLLVGMVDVLHQEVLHVLAEEERQPALHGVVLQVLLRGQVAVRELPGIEAGGGIVLDVLRPGHPAPTPACAARPRSAPWPPILRSFRSPRRSRRRSGSAAHHVAQPFWPGRRSRHPRYPPGTAS